MTEKPHMEKSRLLEGALSLYSKYGFKSVTIEDISRDLGISKKTVYQLIADKSELIREVLQHEEDMQSEQMEILQHAEMNAIDELLGLNLLLHSGQQLHSPAFYFDLKKYYPALYEKWMRERSRRSQDMFIRNLQKGISEGLYREDLNVEFISSLHRACAETLHTSSYFDSDSSKGLDFIDEIFAYHIYGICNERGLKYYKIRYINRKEIT